MPILRTVAGNTMIHPHNGVLTLCVAGNKNKENLYKLIWRDFQDILLSKKIKEKITKSIYSILHFK